MILKPYPEITLLTPSGDYFYSEPSVEIRFENIDFRKFLTKIFHKEEGLDEAITIKRHK